MSARIEKLKTMSLQDIINEAKPTAEELDIINYSGENKRIIASKSHLTMQLVAKVFNTDENGNTWQPNWNNTSERKWFPVFDMRNGGVGFSCSRCDDWLADSDAGSRLCFQTEALSDLSVKMFPQLYTDMLSLS